MKPYVPGWILKNYNIFKWGQVNGMICTSNTCRPCPQYENNDLSIDHHDPYWAQGSDHIFSPNLESVCTHNPTALSASSGMLEHGPTLVLCQSHAWYRQGQTYPQLMCIKFLWCSIVVNLRGDVGSTIEQYEHHRNFTMSLSQIIIRVLQIKAFNCL